MKRLFSCLLAFIFILSLFTCNSYAEGNSLQLYYDGAVHQYTGRICSLKIDGDPVNAPVPGIIINERTMVPVRAIFEHARLGARVDWDSVNKKVLIALNNTNIELKINDKKALVNGKEVEMDVPAKIVNDSTLVPVRFISEQLNMKVGWVEGQNLVTIDHSSLDSIMFSNADSKEIVELSLGYYKNYKIGRLSNPDRIYIDFPNVKVSDSLQKGQPSGNSIKNLRYSSFEDPNTGYRAARVVLDTNGQPEYQLSELENKVLINVASSIPAGLPTVDRGNVDRGSVQQPSTPDTGTPPAQAPLPSNTPASPSAPAGEQPGIQLNITHNRNGSTSEVTIPFENYKNYNILRYTDPDKIVIDIPSNGIKVRKDQINVNEGLVKTIRYAQFNDSTVRVVMDVSGQPDYSVDERDGSLVVCLESPTYRNIEYHNGSDGTYFLLNGAKLGTADLYSGSYDATGNKYTLTFSSSLADLGSGTMKINDGIFNKVVIARTSGSTSITFDAKDRFLFDVAYSKASGASSVNVLQPLNKNVVYRNTGDRVAFTLPGIKLTDGGSELVKYYSESYDTTGRKYSITFSNSVAQLGAGIMNIRDNCFESVKVTKNPGTKETTITFDAKDKYSYRIVYRSLTNDTAITVLKPASVSDKLVIIDAGHGGAETGAAPTGDFLEKNINLDIALRLNALLRKKGVKTYMIREDDSYVWFFERAYIANDLKAALFLSIHNNSYLPEAKGTETLYYPQDPNNKNFNSKRLAELVQDSLLRNLKTVDRKIQPHPEFVVLNSTDMPSVITEVGFMTNKDEAPNLKNPAYRQKAAEALYDAVLKSLSEIK